MDLLYIFMVLGATIFYVAVPEFEMKLTEMLIVIGLMFILQILVKIEKRGK